MMDTLDRFLTKEFFSYFILIALGLAFLFLGVDFLSKFWNMKLPMAKILEIYGYKLPGALQQFIPVACLMATLLLLTSMSKQNEILALNSCGVGTLRIVSTLVATVAIISTMSFLVFDNLVPLFTRRQILVSQGLDPSREYVSNFNHGSFWFRSDNMIYNIGRFEPSSNTIQDVEIYKLSPSFSIQEKIQAREGNFTDGEWTLRHGFKVLYPAESPFPTEEMFDSLRGIIPEKPSDFKTIKIQEDTMRLKDLRKFIGKNQAGGLDTTSQEVNYHERIALVFTPLVFVLLAVPFALKPLKSHSVGRSVGFCFLIVFLYLLLFRTSVSIGKGGHIPPLLAAWAPNMLFLVVSGLFITRRP